MPFKSPTSEQLSNRVIECDSNLVLVRNPYSELHLLDDIKSPEYPMTDEKNRTNVRQILERIMQLISSVAASMYLPCSLNSRIFLNSCRLDKLDEPCACFHTHITQAS